MKNTTKRLLSCMVALALVITSLNLGVLQSTTAKAGSIGKDTTWDFYEVSYLNFLNRGNKESSSFTVPESTAKEFRSYEPTRVTSGMTFYTRDGLWCLSGSTNANAFKIESLSYQGTDLNVKLDIPDTIRFHYIDSIERVKDSEDLYAVSTTSCEATVTSIGTAFSFSNDKSTCTSLDLTVPKRVTIVEDRAFYNNTKLTSLSFDGDIQAIGSSAFEGCTRLKTLDLAGVFETVATNTIPDRCFYKCSSLENIVIPETILNIGSEAFYQCNKIDYLVLKDSIKTIGNNAFAMCSNLRYLYIESSYSDWTNVVDKTEQYKLITTPIKSEPLLAKKGDSSALGGFVYDTTDVAISSRVDIDLGTVSVTKDGVVIPTFSYTNNMYGYNTNAVYFKIGKDDKGIYNIKGKDILGNTLDKTINYFANLDDKVPPTIELDGVGSNDWYQSVKVNIWDNESYVSSATLDGNPISVASGSSIDCDTEGKHTVVVKDAFGNTTTKEFGIDKTVPVLEDIEDNAQYTRSVTVKIKEEGSGIKDITLNGTSLGNTSPVNIFENGVHTLIVTDNALNKVEYHFTIDSVGPIIKDLYNNKDYNHDIVCDIQSVCGLKNIEVSYRALDGSQTSYFVNAGDILNVEGEYSVKVTDVLGNSNNYNFKIDKTAPEVKGVSNGKFYKKELEISANDINLATIVLNGKEAGRTETIKDDGVYTYIVTDTAGNETKVNFVKDTVKPTLVGIKNKGKYAGVFNLTAKDNIGVKSIKLNGKTVKYGYKIKKSKSYKVIVTDNAGNKSKYNFSVDVKAPKVNIENGAKYKKVTIKAKDDFSGVSIIKLDGKKVKNKTVVTKKGSHILLVKDNYGNKTTVKFKIK